MTCLHLPFPCSKNPLFHPVTLTAEWLTYLPTYKALKKYLKHLCDREGCGNDTLLPFTD